MNYDDDSIQVRGDRNALAEEMASVDFDYDAIDRGNPLAAVLHEDDGAYREAARQSMDFYRRVFMVIQDFRGDKSFANDCAMLALGWFDLARARTQQELAVRYKCERANVNRLVNKFQALLSITPCIGQRTETSRAKFSEARKKQLKP